MHKDFFIGLDAAVFEYARANGFAASRTNWRVLLCEDARDVSYTFTPIAAQPVIPHETRPTAPEHGDECWFVLDSDIYYDRGKERRTLSLKKQPWDDENGGHWLALAEGRVFSDRDRARQDLISRMATMLTDHATKTEQPK